MSRFGVHECAAPGCNATIKASLLMCFEHWRLVEPVTQKQVNHYFNPRQLITRKPSKSYINAAKRAIKQVENKLAVAS